MINFFNLKTNSWTKFYLNETEEVIDDLLESSFKDINEIFFYIKLDEEHDLVKKLHDKENNAQKILLLLMNSSINAYGESVYNALNFEHEEIKKIIEDMYMGFDKNDLFDSITKICYSLIDKEMKRRENSWINKILN